MFPGGFIPGPGPATDGISAGPPINAWLKPGAGGFSAPGIGGIRVAWDGGAVAWGLLSPCNQGGIWED